MASSSLTRLQIHNVRNLRQVSLDSLRRVNVFYGRNGSGKTSVLEAIHLLAMARSFRGGIRSVITHGQEHCTVFGLLAPTGLPMGIRREIGGKVQIKVGGEPVRAVAELVAHLPIQVLTADSFNLLTGSPGARRRYLDWGVFHVEHRFYEQWQRFQRGIKQRNNLLRRGKITDEELAVWTRDLAASGEALGRYRSAYFELITPRFKAIMSQLAPSLTGLELRYRQGWDKEISYRQALENSERSDREQGYTRVGPQRADIRVLIDGNSAAEILSRGQQKLVVCGLKLAQGQLMTDEGQGQCTYLVDDLPSELDTQHGRQVCEFLASMRAQVFITCVERDDIAAVWPDANNTELALFHVEHGEVSAQSTRGAEYYDNNASHRD